MTVENATPEVDNVTPELNDSEVKVDAGEVQEPVGSEAWYQTLDPDLRNNPSIQKFKDPAGLAKSYVELQKMIGKEKVVIPNEKSTPEEWANFYKKVGRPDEFTGYETPEFKELPEEIKMREENLETFKQKCHELGLSKKQFAELIATYYDISLNTYKQSVDEAVKLKETTETTLRKEWGQAYESKVDSAQKVINTFFKGKGLHKAFEVLSNDKGFVAAMSEIAESLGEDKIAGEVRNVLTPEEAQKEINAMLGNAKHPLFDELHPEHKAAVDKYNELTKMAG